MNTARRTAAGIAMALSLTGCGSLRVQVSVLNPAAVEAEADRQLLVRTLPQVVGQTEADARAQVIEYSQEHFNLISSIANQYLAEAAEESDPEKKAHLKELGRSLVADYSSQMPDYYQQVSDKLVEADKKIDELNTKVGQGGDQDRRALANQLRIRGQILKNLEARVGDEIGSEKHLTSYLSGRRRSLALSELHMSDVRRKSLIPGAPIGEDPFAFAVASASEELWADRFNRVVGHGIMGNFNMAVKLEDSGSYTIKGLTFDPSDVARVAGKVTTQALLIATQLAGVPVQTQSQAGAPAGSALATSSKSVAEAEMARAQQQARLLSHKDGLQTLASTILREWPSLDNDDAAKRKAGIAGIKAGLTANLARLRLEATGSNPPPDSGDGSDEDEASEEEANQP